MGEHVLELYIQQLQRYSPGFGWFGINLFLVLKLLLLFSVTYEAFGSEGWRPKDTSDYSKPYWKKKYVGGIYSGTECDTKTPGCEIGCINQLWPIAPMSFWYIELVMMALPMIIFVVYCYHIEHTSMLIRGKHIDNLAQLRFDEDSKFRKQRVRTFKRAYLIMCLSR